MPTETTIEVGEGKSLELALHGGPKAFAGKTRPFRPQLGIEEFFALAERYGLKSDAMARLRSTFSDADLTEEGVFLGRFGYPRMEETANVRYEQAAKAKFGVPFALAVSSGTGALHAAFVAVGVGPGAEVICPALGFAATPMASMLAGGVPVFCEVDESLHMDPTKIEALITPRTVALAPTHHWGGVCDMEPILAVARRHNLKVVEDCAQSPGARYRGHYVGTLGDVGCFSISCYKLIGGGEGGLALCRDQGLFDRVRQVADGGGLFRPQRFAAERYPGELFPGGNYRMSELEATVDLVQLGKLDEVVRRFQKVSRRIRSRIGLPAGVCLQKINDEEGAIGYQIALFPPTPEHGRRIAAALKAEGIPAHCRGRERGMDWHCATDMLPVILKQGHAPGGSVFEDPRYLSRAGRAPTYGRGTLPISEDLWTRGVYFWVDQWWTEAECDAVAAGISKVLNAYCSQDEDAKPC
jgi:dTDP-4-amino-4,6-dideoxygalactose transaminase